MTRRRLLTLGAAGAAGSGAYAWYRTSDTFLARFLRQCRADAKREPAAAPLRPEPGSWSDAKLTAAWLGHASVLMNFHGLRVITDPVLADRCGIDVGAFVLGPKRYVAPALRAPEVGGVDLVVLSHAHFDHLDLPTLQAMPRSAKVVCSSGLGDLVRAAGWSEAVELKWGERAEVVTERGAVTVTSVPTRHWGARVRRDTWRGWGGFVLEREGRRVLFGGDTAWTDRFGEVRARGRVDLALMPIGAYDPWIYAHCTPEEAVRMADAAGAEVVAPIHHQTFKLSHEPMRQPIERFQQALTHDEHRVAWREVGQTIVV